MTAALLQIRCHGADDLYAMYRAGYYVNSNAAGDFFWDKEPTRFVISLNEAVLNKSRRMLRECPLPCVFTFSKHSRAVLDLIELNKEKKWFTPFVKSLYEEMLEAQYAFTVEASCDGRVVGGLVGIAVGRVLTIDTLVGSTESPNHRSTSKAALCHLVALAYQQGITLIDGEVKHDRAHPAARLGEHEISHTAFRHHLSCDFAGSHTFVVANLGKTFFDGVQAPQEEGCA